MRLPDLNLRHLLHNYSILKQTVKNNHGLQKTSLLAIMVGLEGRPVTAEAFLQLMLLSHVVMEALVCGKEKRLVVARLPLSLMSKPSVACARAGRSAA